MKRAVFNYNMFSECFADIMTCEYHDTPPDIIFAGKGLRSISDTIPVYHYNVIGGKYKMKKSLTEEKVFYIISIDQKCRAISLEHRGISRAVISRLPRYYRYLGDLLEMGVERISSSDLSKKMHVTASQIRQDLNNFGGFGQQGYGYNVKYLYTEIGKILGLDQNHNFIIIGAGNLGQALANYAAFERSGFILKSLFDVNPRLEGVSIRGIPVRMMDELEGFLHDNDIEIAALTIPKSKAIEVADILVANGIKGIWNFAHTDLTLPKDVVVESVHLSDSLMQLSYNISRRNDGKRK